MRSPKYADARASVPMLHLEVVANASTGFALVYVVFVVGAHGSIVGSAVRIALRCVSASQPSVFALYSAP